MNRRIVQVVHTFLVTADTLQEAQELLAEALTVHAAPGVVITQRQIKSSDPFRLPEDD